MRDFEIFDDPNTAPSSRTGGYAKGAAKREEILAGVMAMLARERYSKLTLQVIGDALGIKPAHILYYFSSREDLFQTVIRRWDRDPRFSRVGAAAGQSGLELLVLAVRRNAALPGMVHLYHALAAEAIDPGHVAHEFFKQRFNHLRDRLGQAIRLEQAAGTIDTDLDADRSARELIALADGLQLQSLVDTAIDPVEDLTAAIARLRLPKRSPA